MAPHILIRALSAAISLIVVPSVSSAQIVALPGQGPSDPPIPTRPSSTPPGKDTVGYWQQRADYRIVVTLDERNFGVHATGTLHYVNKSPDALTELWLHQHLNAFRPGSRWSAIDEREGRKRFQSLSDPQYAYERFTSVPRINGVAVTPEYPLSPDSTVVRLPLTTPLRSGDSLNVDFAWDARPATVPRRQGRRDRSYDFAQWYPKVAVYDRTGWHPNALVPAGEFYGEYGTFDVTMVLPNDQVVGATGVPVSGDPGWEHASAPGAPLPRTAASAYPDILAGTGVTAPPGYRTVRFHARNVHHFAWSISPGFRYEGAEYVRTQFAPPGRVPVWITVPVHALYRADAQYDCSKANDSLYADTARYGRGVRACVNSSLTQWRDGKAVGYGLTSLAWLESIYGPYPYPQMTVLKRLDGGGTEFPMMQMNGSASLGLTLHEGGHIFTYGIVGNNEWQSGWMDEGLTSYQSDWYAGEVRAMNAARLATANDRDPSNAADSTARRIRFSLDSVAAKFEKQFRDGGAQPIGTRADQFKTFQVYNDAVYARAQLMYQALHDVLGDAPFRAFLKDYYARWTFRHVDRWAMQGSAERVSRKNLDWFFNQWVNEVGVIDYALRTPTVTKTATGWVIKATVERVGAYRHPMPIGVRTAKGWVMARADAALDTQSVSITVRDRPDAIWLDPFGATDSQTAKSYRLTLTPGP